MKSEETKVSRRKMVGWLGVVSVFAAAGSFFRFSNKSVKKTGKVKMLTQDGKLVEIDASLLADSKQKVSNAELQTWISRKK